MRMGRRAMRMWVLGLALAASLAGRPAIAQETPTDQEIRHQLNALPRISVFDWLQWSYDKGTVTLTGSVWQPITKQDAEGAVKRVPGVDTVVNNIEVQPNSPNDDRIRMRVYRAIYRNTTLERYAIQYAPPIRIIVRNGRVTLEGVVADQGDRTIANVQANTVPGVFQVTNNLKVEGRQ
jgi:hyperosmotically inducible periplasmic protein